MSLDVQALDAETLLQQWGDGANLVGSETERLLAVLVTAVRGVVANATGGASTVALNEVVEARVGALIGDAQLASLANALRVRPAKCAGNVIKRVVSVGEIAQDAGNRWRSVPTRLVRLDQDSKVAAIISCEPTLSLQRRFGARIEQCGILRYCRIEELTEEVREDSSLWQSADSWLRVERRSLSLKKWTVATLTSSVTTARQWDQPIETFDIFMPGKTRYVWKSSETISRLSERPFLCRSVMPGSKKRKEYWIGFFHDVHGETRLSRRADLSIDDGLRLALGQKLTSFGPRELVLEHVENVFALSRLDDLPMPERRIQTFACQDERGFLRFPTPMSSIVSAVLSSLGYKVPRLIEEDKKDG